MTSIKVFHTENNIFLTQLIDGRYTQYKCIEKNYKKMISPVACNHCGAMYDLTNTKVVHRFADCTVYDTPCCDQRVDDREFTGNPAFKRLQIVTL
jgi:hypothetical protein